jgi:hypothetical protein
MNQKIYYNIHNYPRLGRISRSYTIVHIITFVFSIVLIIFRLNFALTSRLTLIFYMSNLSHLY